MFSQMDRITRQLERIVIPKLELKNATLREAVDFLKKKSIELDTASPRNERGVNIVLKVESLSSVGVPDEPAPPVTPIAGLDQAPPAPRPTGDPSEARITVSLTNIPLVEALKYVTGLANLKFKVEPYAVTIVPQSVNTDVLLTREWRVSPDSIPKKDGKRSEDDAKDWLVANGVQFSEGASATYYAQAGRLAVQLILEQSPLVWTVSSRTLMVTRSSF